MPLRHLWAGSPCQRPVRRPLRYAEMSLRYLWAGLPCQRPVRRTLSHAITCIRWSCPLHVCAGAQASLSLPLFAAIDLHEIHLAPQPSLQVPVGHIPVPGGIKLCSPGTFLVANYLIINNGSFQVNFTKPNSATIRCTNSQWHRDDPIEASVGLLSVLKTVQKPPLSRRDATEASVGRVAVPKDGQKNASPREDAPEASVGRGAVPKTVQEPPSPREDTPEASVGRAAVPKGRQMTSLPREHTPEVLLGDGAVPKPIAGSEVSGSQGSRFSGLFRDVGG